VLATAYHNYTYLYSSKLYTLNEFLKFIEISNMVLRNTLVILTALVLLSTSLFSRNYTIGGDTTSSSVYYSLDACDAFVNAGTLADYSEFVGVTNNDPSCTSIFPSGTIYRTNPSVNTHSCTPGVNGSSAMCVSSEESCTYNPTSEKAIKIELMVSPGPSGSGSLSTLSFFEKAPETYDWISGPSGINNYPTQYGIRVLKDGVEIFRQEGIATTTDWTLETFDFSNNPDFTVTGNSFFTIELLGYCVIGNGAAATAWDIDEVTISSVCQSSNVIGGDLSIVGGGTTIDICANDGISDEFDVVLTGNTGSDATYIITDENGMILNVGGGPTFDLEGAGSGTCFIWNVASSGTVTGLTEGADVNNVTGCFALSNPIVVNRNMQGGGTLSTTDGFTQVSICVGDGVADPINVNLTGNTGSNMAWVITDAASGMILGLPAGPPFDLEGAGLGSCNIYNVSYEGSITGLTMGGSLSDISGCFGLSNPIRVDRTTATAGSISANGQTTFNVCTSDGVPDPLDIDVIGNIGTNESYVVTDVNGNILRVLPVSPTVNVDGFGTGTCLIYHVSFDGTINGLTTGQNLSGLGGCFGLSNAITVNKQATTGGVFSTNLFTFVSICENDGTSNVIETTLNNNMGANVQYFIADTDGNIIQFITGPPFDFSSFDRGRYSLYAFSYDGPSSGLNIGQNTSTLVGACNGLSNPIVIVKGSATGGTISSPLGNNFDVCVQGNVTQGIDFNLTGADGLNSRWIITDLSGNIIGLPGPPPINIQLAGSAQSCQVYHLSFDAFFTGLAVGSNIADFDGCFELSNAVTINKSIANGGVLAGPGNTSSVNLCNTGGGSTVNLDLNDTVGENSAWIITDQNNNIVATPTGQPFDFASFGTGTYRIYNVSYNGNISGLTVGASANNITGDCFDLSNFVSVNNNSVTPGTVTSPLGNNFSICVGTGVSDLIDFSVSGNSGNGRWLITDTNGVIIDLPGNPPFNLSGNTSTCLVWFLSTSGNVGGLAIGNNASGLSGCFALSNSVTVNKSDVNGGVISTDNNTTSVTVCVGDGTPDFVNVVLDNATGANNQWIITDANGNILGLPAGPPFEFDGAGLGACQIYNASYEGTLSGAVVGNNLNSVTADCIGLSNSITVDRIQPDAGTISTNGSTSVEVCIDDPNDTVPVTVNGGATTGVKGWIITDASGEILGLPSGPPFSFTGAGTGACNVYRICSNGMVTGMTVGGNLSALAGCFNLSNSITVTRIEAGPGSSATSKLTFDMEACYSDQTDNSSKDYSEFTANVMNDAACTQFSVLSGGFLYRRDPNTNMHSCTDGVNGGVAMCVSSQDDCTFTDDSDSAIRFDIEVTPGTSGTGSISGLSFQEKAPTMFQWINGATGINNYPTNYGVRILKDGVEVFRQVDLNTTTDWTLESFDFSNNADFTVTQTSVFTFELLGYCTVGNGAAVNAWDIDEVMLTSNCSIAGGCDTTTVTEEEEEEEEIETEDEDEAISFSVRPNPADNLLILEATKEPTEGSMVYIYDRMGRMVDTYTLGQKTIQVSLANYSAGFYYIRMISEGKQTTRKFLKQTK